MAKERSPKKYTRPEKINKDFVMSPPDRNAPKPVRLDCWKCKRKTPHTNGKCNWCKSPHEEELE